jgi:hypothetical protein
MFKCLNLRPVERFSSCSYMIQAIDDAQSICGRFAARDVNCPTSFDDNLLPTSNLSAYRFLRKTHALLTNCCGDACVVL